MPIYEYQCTKCHHHLEALQKISDKPLRECPECGKHTLKRLMSAPLFRLAGSGWYETDFKSDKEGKRNLVGDKGESAEASAPAKSEAKTETKVEAKKESPPAEKTTSRTMVTRPAMKTAKAGRTKAVARKPAKKSGRR
jgi:putative FmdB family regulatory protein